MNCKKNRIYYLKGFSNYRKDTMLSGKFNYHKIMFTLEVLESIEEKKAYITHIRKDIAKTITCFEAEKIVSLRMYGDETVHLEDNCPELQMFIQEMVKKYSPATPDRRVPSNEQLRDLVRKEAQEYHKLDRIMEFYFLELQRDENVITLEDEKNILDKALKAEKESLQNKDKKVEDETSSPGSNIISSMETYNTAFYQNEESYEENEQEKEDDSKKDSDSKILNKHSVDPKKKKEDPTKDDIVRDSH